MILGVDFDGTIVDPTKVEKGYRMGPPMPGAITALNRLADSGHQIVIFTARSVNKPDVYKAVEDWLIHFKIPYHGITNIKQPYFEYMIDNRNIEFRSWPQVMVELRRK